MTEIGRLKLRRCALRLDGVLRARSSQSLDGLNLCPTDAFVLSRVDGALSVQQVVDVSGLSSEAALEAIARLLELGLLETSAPSDLPTQ